MFINKSIKEVCNKECIVRWSWSKWRWWWMNGLSLLAWFKSYRDWITSKTWMYSILKGTRCYIPISFLVIPNMDKYWLQCYTHILLMFLLTVYSIPLWQSHINHTVIKSPQIAGIQFYHSFSHIILDTNALPWNQIEIMCVSTTTCIQKCLIHFLKTSFSDKMHLK